MSRFGKAKCSAVRTLSREEKAEGPTNLGCGGPNKLGQMPGSKHCIENYSHQILKMEESVNH